MMFVLIPLRLSIDSKFGIQDQENVVSHYGTMIILVPYLQKGGQGPE